MSLLNYTTKIEAVKTAGEISEMLRKAGAKAVLTEYDENREYVSSLSFTMILGEREVGFRLPCDWKPVLEILKNDPKVPRRLCEDNEQAIKVAWRIVMRWIIAQLAIIETKMVTTEEIFLPYAIMPNGKTLSETVQSNPSFLLGSGNK